MKAILIAIPNLVVRIDKKFLIFTRKENISNNKIE